MHRARGAAGRFSGPGTRLLPPISPDLRTVQSFPPSRGGVPGEGAHLVAELLLHLRADPRGVRGPVRVRLRRRRGRRRRDRGAVRRRRRGDAARAHVKQHHLRPAAIDSLRAGLAAAGVT